MFPLMFLLSHTHTICTALNKEERSVMTEENNNRMTDTNGKTFEDIEVEPDAMKEPIFANQYQEESSDDIEIPETLEEPNFSNQYQAEKSSDDIEIADTPDEANFSNQYREETAAEYMPNPGLAGRSKGSLEFSPDTGAQDYEGEEDLEETESAGKGMGAVGIAFAIVSLFMLPVVFAIAGIIFGAISVKKDRKALGYTAIVISAFSLFVSFFFAPFVLG